MCECNKRCTISFLQSMNYSNQLMNVLDLFMNAIKDQSISIRNSTISKIYNYLFKKKIVFCELGMFYIDKYLFEKKYKLILSYGDNTRNQFINNKIKLYNWLEPKHLEINESIPLIFNNNPEENFYGINDCIYHLNTLEENIFPYQKKVHILKIFREIYDIIDKNSSYDDMFTVLIYMIIKSQTKDLLLHLNFIRLWERKKYDDCTEKCVHILGNDCIQPCNCYTGYLNFLESDICKDTEETDYYLTTFEAALLFIERLEFLNLKISKEEFDSKIENYNLTFTSNDKPENRLVEANLATMKKNTMGEKLIRKIKKYFFLK